LLALEGFAVVGEAVAALVGSRMRLLGVAAAGLRWRSRRSR